MRNRFDVNNYLSECYLPVVNGGGMLSVQDLFVTEQPGFAIKAGSVTGEAAVGADDAVAGNDEGDGVVANGAANRLGGHPMGRRLDGFGNRNAPVRQG